jgi:hypothetical protein
MKTHIIIVVALAVIGFAATPCKAETNTIHVAGMEIPVRFPESGLDFSRWELIRQDAERYFKQVDQLLSAEQGGTNLVAVRSAAMVARNPEFENGLRFEVGPAGTNLVVSDSLASRYGLLDNWSIRTNLLSKTDTLVLTLRNGPTSLSTAERRQLFRRYENGLFRVPSAEEASDEEVVAALSDIAVRFDFSGACLLELEQSSEASCWMIPLRYGFAAGTNNFEKAILSAPAVFVDGSWALTF